jgi:O-antigen/teichoic acid export membrane protein
MFEKIIAFLKKPKQSLWYSSVLIFILKISGILANYLLSVIVTQSFGSEGWGIMSLGLGYVTFGILFSKLGFDTALLKYTAAFNNGNHKGKIKGIYLNGLKVILPVSLIIGLIFSFSVPLVCQHLFHKAHLSPYILLLSYSIIPNVFILINSEGLRGLGKIKEYVFFQNVGIFLLACIIILFNRFILNASGTLYSIIIAYDISVIVMCLIVTYSWIKNIFPLPAFSDNLKVKEIIATSIPMFWSNAMFVLINWTDTLMLGIYSTADQVGIYNVCFKISSLVYLPLQVITSLVAPQFSSLYETKNMGKFSEIVHQSTKTIFLFTLPIFLPLAFMPDFFLELFGREFGIGAPILLILISGQFFKSFCGSTDFILQMTGNEKIFQNIIICAMILNITLNFILIPSLGGTGAAISNVITVISWNILAIVFIRKKLNILPLYIPFRSS